MEIPTKYFGIFAFIWFGVWTELVACKRSSLHWSSEYVRKQTPTAHKRYRRHDLKNTNSRKTTYFPTLSRSIKISNCCILLVLNIKILLKKTMIVESKVWRRHDLRNTKSRAKNLLFDFCQKIKIGNCCILLGLNIKILIKNDDRKIKSMEEAWP